MIGLLGCGVFACGLLTLSVADGATVRAPFGEAPAWSTVAAWLAIAALFVGVALIGADLANFISTHRVE